MGEIANKGRALGLLLLLGGCVPAVADRPGAPVAPTGSTVYPVEGLEGVIGRTAAVLVRQFGQPDLDIREGPARKLQFASQVCVLDTYLYPPRAGGEPIVTYIDARLPDGRDIDRASCVAAMSRRGR